MRQACEFSGKTPRLGWEYRAHPGGVDGHLGIDRGERRFPIPWSASTGHGSTVLQKKLFCSGDWNMEDDEGGGDGAQQKPSRKLTLPTGAEDCQKSFRISAKGCAKQKKKKKFANGGRQGPGAPRFLDQSRKKQRRKVLILREEEESADFSVPSISCFF